MNVLIISSSRDEINEKYKILARNISNYLATNNYNLVFGGASTSMMGICYQEFDKLNRKIYAYTTPKYLDDLENLKNAKSIICETTFDLKKDMFKKSDLIICLPGGIGTISELLSYIEEKRSNNKDIPIIICDEDNYYEYLLNTLEQTIINNFSDNKIYNMFSIVHNLDELKKIIRKEDTI